MEKTVITCDICGTLIAETHAYVNADAYGVHFHLGCFSEMKATDAIVALNIDDIKIMKYGDWQNATKANSYWRK